MKRKPKTARKRMYERLDKLWQRVILARSAGTCELCAEPAYCGHHIFTKASSLRTRWEPDNGVAVCRRCHIGCHGSRYAEYLAKIQDEIGADFNRMRQLHVQIAKFKMDDLREIEKRLQLALGGPPWKRERRAQG